MDSISGKVVDCATSVVTSVVGEQVDYILQYEDNFTDLENKVGELRLAVEEIKTSVEEDERRHGMQMRDYVKTWLLYANAFIEDAENHIGCPNRHNARLVCHPWSCVYTDLKLRRKLSKQAKEMVADGEELMKTRKGFKELCVHPHPDYPGTSYSDADIFKSREKTMEQIMEAVKNPNIRKIGIYGLEGVGKTTLAKLVGSKAKQDELFDVVVEAKVGESPDNKKIQQSIADSLGLKFEDESVKARAKRIREAIEREKSVLVILEEVCTMIELGELGIPDTTSSRKANNNLEGDSNNVASATTTFMNSEKGKFASSNADSVVCKILMTSGSEEKLREMGCETENNFLVEPLEPEEALRMFKDKAGLDAPGKDNEWQKIGKKIARKCEGLPAFITTMATKLKHKDIANWKAALTELSSNNTTGTMKHKIVHSALKLCTNEERRLLLLCGMKQSTCVSDLLKYGIGLGIFPKANNVEDARNILGRTISSLKASCLLFDDSTPEFVTMSNMIRDVSISIASSDHHYFVRKEEDDALEEWPGDDFLKSCPLISLYVHCKDKLPQKPHCPELEFFCLSTPSTTPSNIIPESFFEGSSNLKVVDLTHMVMRPSLPASLASLNQLKTLCLDYCELGDMSGIGGLGNLEILSLLGFPLKQLPSEIGKLTKLRLLDLSQSAIEVIPPNVISKLVKLEEFYMRECSIKWRLENNTAPEQNEASLSELGHLTNLTALEIQIQDPAMLPKDLNLQKLERYKILVGEEESWAWFDTNKASKTLKLKLGLQNKHGLNTWLKALLEKVENLYLDEISSKISKGLYHLNTEGFRELKHLHIHNNSKIKYLVDKSNKVEAFPNLETLELSNLSSLEKICNGRLAENSFNKLRVIKVRDCGQLQCLIILPSMVKAFSQLSEIEVYDCKYLKNIVLLERQDRDTSTDIEFTSLKSLTLKNLPQVHHFCSDDSAMSSFFNSKLAFPSLETLMLSSMNINKLWDDEVQASSIKKLADLTVENCGGLKYIFSPSMVQSFSNFKQLEIENCDAMEEIIKATDGVASHEVVFPKLKKISISNMKSLRAVWHYQFDKADTLEVHNCECLGNIFPSDRQTKFQNLKKLVVTRCNLLEVIFGMSSINNGGNGTTLLEELFLDELPNLKRIWSEDPQEIMTNSNYVHFSNLRELYVTECEDLEYLFPSSIALDEKLRVETIVLSGALEMKELVVSKKQAGPMDTLKFKFENLTFLVLSELPLLNTFYAGDHCLSCPSLKILGVGGCTNLKLFDDKLHHVSLPEHHHEPLFKAEEVIPNLEQLGVSYEEDKIIEYTHSEVQLFDSEPKTLVVQDSSEEAIFPNWLLQHLSDRLETLIIRDSSFKKIFQDKREDIITLKNLTLKSLSHLEYICEEGSPLDNTLEVLEVIECPKLTHLVPSCVTFGYLKQMIVDDCDGLIHLFASSTATSLTELTSLKIEGCDALRQIVTDAAEETKDEFKVAFRSLKTLELQNLPSLTRFCSCMFIFPSLEEVIVEQCPGLEVFSEKKTSAPKLQKLQADDKRINLENFDGDLNCIIKDMLHHKSVEEENEGRGKEWSSSEENVGNPKADEIVETGKDHATTRDLSPTMHSAQTMSEDAEGPIPPLPPPARGPEVEANAYTSYKGMFDISVENVSYLKDGLERHPQVLEWLNTSKAQRERHRVYASSMFSLFADVTRLMRTTRRGELTEDDRNYIMQCCKSLEFAGFDASWLSHVRGCLDKCCDGETLKKTLEESETKAFALKALLEFTTKDLASLEDSLVLLRQRDNMLLDFIDS